MNPYTSPIAPDLEPDPFTRRCAIEFNAAGFVHQANQYAQEKEAMSAHDIPGYTNFLTQLDQHLKESDPEWYEQMQETLREWDAFRASEETANPCDYCPNTNAIDGLCPSCLAREEADAATYYDLRCMECGKTVPTLGESICPSERKDGAPTLCPSCSIVIEQEYYAHLAEMKAGQRAEDMTNGGIEPSWCACGAPIPEEGDACPDCAQASVPEEVKAMKPYRVCPSGDHEFGSKPLGCEACRDEARRRNGWEPLPDATKAFIRRVERTFLLLSLFLALTTQHSSAASYTPTAPIGCTVTHFASQDDLSATAVCAGGYLISKEDGPRDIWNDIPYSVETLHLTDANGIMHDVPKLD